MIGVGDRGPGAGCQGSGVGGGGENKEVLRTYIYKATASCEALKSKTHSVFHGH